LSGARLYAETVAVTQLGEPTIDRMWALFARYYADVCHEAFVRDLRAKDEVFLLRDRADGSLRGFSTVQSYLRVVGGRRVHVIYSGDTICDQRFWGQRALHVAFLRYALRRKVAHPLTPTYWFLISKGYKTYLLLARNFIEFWPRLERPMPRRQRALLDALAREKFGEAWSPERGVLHFAAPQGRLRPDVTPTGVIELADPHIRFFALRNPGAAQGDELCCLGRIDVGLVLKFACRRVVRALGMARRAPVDGIRLPHGA
jgi:hypothetical protein